METNGLLLYKKFKYLDIMIYRGNAECFVLPTIIYGISGGIYKPSIGIAWLRTHIIVYFKKKLI